MSDPVVLLSTGDVVGPAGGVTDNSMVLFNGTSGKLIKGNNAVVTAAGLALLDDVNAAAQRVTLGLGNVDNTSDVNKPISTATQTALNLKAPLGSPAFTGIPTAPTASAGTSTTQLATTAFVTAAGNLKANINSPTFTGVPSAPTPTSGTRSTAIATMQNFANEFGSYFAPSGWQRLPSGLIMQWGEVANVTADAVQAVTYPIAFPSLVIGMLANLKISAAATNPTSVYSSSTSLSAGVVVRDVAASPYATGPIFWIAIGY